MFPIRDVNPTRMRPVMTWALIAVNVFVFFGWQPQDSDAAAAEFAYAHAAIPCEITTGEPLDVAEIGGPCIEAPLGQVVFPDKNVWLSVVVSMFLHGGIAHLLFNMWSLWIFGNNVEEAFGRGGYLLFYLVAGFGATAGFVALNPDTTAPLVGASGAIAGVMGAYLVLFPRHQVMTLVIIRIVAIPAVLFLGLWLASQFFLIGAQSGIAWEAHVAGFALGVLVTLPLRETLLRRTLAGSPYAAAGYRI
ncbi:MAG: rhomboid family intramembrane serine protease [Actinobacteria bacterium]|nr:rhomboid family intramembrane serine protease [Actinomycetota bacterium]MBU1865232.1 rhomboid family intramembrane serine protease [Actinomycetota bacterium]